MDNPSKAEELEKQLGIAHKKTPRLEVVSFMCTAVLPHGILYETSIKEVPTIAQTYHALTGYQSTQAFALPLLRHVLRKAGCPLEEINKLVSCALPIQETGRQESDGDQCDFLCGELRQELDFRKLLVDIRDHLVEDQRRHLIDLGYAYVNTMPEYTKSLLEHFLHLMEGVVISAMNVTKLYGWLTAIERWDTLSKVDEYCRKYDLPARFWLKQQQKQNTPDPSYPFTTPVQATQSEEVGVLATPVQAQYRGPLRQVHQQPDILKLHGFVEQDLPKNNTAEPTQREKELEEDQDSTDGHIYTGQDTLSDTSSDNAEPGEKMRLLYVVNDTVTAGEDIEACKSSCPGYCKIGISTCGLCGVFLILALLASVLCLVFVHLSHTAANGQVYIRQRDTVLTRVNGFSPNDHSTVSFTVRSDSDEEYLVNLFRTSKSCEELILHSKRVNTTINPINVSKFEDHTFGLYIIYLPVGSELSLNVSVIGEGIFKQCSAALYYFTDVHSYDAFTQYEEKKGGKVLSCLPVTNSSSSHHILPFAPHEMSYYFFGAYIPTGKEGVRTLTFQATGMAKYYDNESYPVSCQLTPEHSNCEVSLQHTSCILAYSNAEIELSYYVYTRIMLQWYFKGAAFTVSCVFVILVNVVGVAVCCCYWKKRRKKKSCC